MTLSSFDTPIDAAVFGASGGIGRAFVDQLANDPGIGTVHAFSRRPIASGGKVMAATYDPTRQDSIEDAVARLPEEKVRLVLVAVGTLHDGAEGPEKALRDLEPERFLDVMRINALIPSMIGKACLPFFRQRGDRAIFAALSARVGSISDNRLGGWHSYRASKAALNQLVRNMALEVGRRNPDAIAVTLHPGTVDTPLSAPFQKNVPEDKLFRPAWSAERLLGVVDGLTPEQSGRCFDYAGKEIAP